MSEKAKRDSKIKIRTKYPQTDKLCNAYVICAIDLGTTFSGISYCIAFDPPDDAAPGEGLKMDIFTFGADSNHQTNQLKSPTILVVSSEFEEKYTIGAGAYQRAIWEKSSYIVQDFKMELDILSRRQKEGEILLRNTKVKLYCVDPSVSPLEWPLSKVFIKYLQVCRKLATTRVLSHTESTGVRGVTANDINWVITVPAIWTDQARIFMREVAEKAGFLSSTESLFSSRLSICLEPEGAALEVLSEYSDWAFLVGRRIIIIDLGGGTADFTHHKVEQADFKKSLLHLSEARPPSGGPFGGKLFEEAYCEEILLPILGEHAYMNFKTNPEAYQRIIQHDLLRCKFGFTGKESFSFNPRGFSQYDLGVTTEEIGENVKALKASKHPELVLNGERVTVPAQFLRSFFHRIIDPVKNHLTQIMQSEPPGTIQFAFLAGGMGANNYVYRQLEEHWKLLGGTALWRARESSLAVVRGGARFAYNSDIFGARKSRTNYGTDVRNKGFKRLVAKGENLEEIELRTTKQPFVFHPTKESNKRIRFGIYETETPDANRLSQCILVTETRLEIDRTLPFDKRRYFVTLKVEGNVLTGYMRAAHQSDEEAVRLKWTSR